MNIFMKKTYECTPEDKLQEACIHVEAQQAGFQKMAQEVKYAMDLRAEATEELKKEVLSLEAKLRGKEGLIENAQHQNQADNQFINRLNEMMGL